MATNQDLEVLITADASGVKTGMTEAKDVIGSSTAGIASSMKTMEESSKSSIQGMLGSLQGLISGAMNGHRAVAEGAVKSAETLSEGMKSTTEHIKEGLGGIGEAFEAVSKHIGLLAGIVAGGAFFGEAIKETNEWNGNALKLAKGLGVTTEKASDLMVACHGLGIDSGILVTATQKLSIQIQKGGEGFKKMGIAVKEANGEFRPAIDIIGETNEKLKEIHNPILQNQAGMAAYGKAWAEIKPLMKLTSEGMDEAAKKAKALGIEVSGEQAAKTKEYKMAMNELHLAMEAISINVGEAILPLFAKLAEAFSEVAAKVVELLKPAFELLGFAADTCMEVLTQLWDMLVEVAKTVMETFKSAFKETFGDSVPADVDYAAGVLNAFKTVFVGLKVGLLIGFQAIATALQVSMDVWLMWSKVCTRALHLDFAGAKAAVNEGCTAIENRLRESAAKMAEIAQQGNDQLAGIWMGTGAKKPGEKEHDEHVDPKLDFSKAAKEKKPKKEKADKSAMQGLEQELAQKKADFAEMKREQGSYVDFSKQQELEYWQSKLTTVKKGSADYKAIMLKINEDKLTIDKKGFADSITDLKNKLEEEKGNGEARINIANQIAAKMQTAFGAESKEYKDAQHQILMIARENKDQLNKIEEEKASFAKSKLLDQISQQEEISNMKQALGQQDINKSLQLEREFENQKNDIERKALQDSLALVDPLHDPLQVQKINDQLLTQEMKHQDQIAAIDRKAITAQQSMYTSLANTISNTMATTIDGLVERTTTLKQAMNNVIKSVFESSVQMMTQIAAKWAITQATQALQGKIAAASNITDSAASGSAAAIASTAAIPVVGPAAAPAAGAGIFATIMSMMAGLSAEGGFDIPAGVNPVTQLHQKEMVLPADIAEPMRNKIKNGDTGDGAFHMHIHATDADSVQRLFQNNADALFKVIKQQHRNFSTGM